MGFGKRFTRRSMISLAGGVVQRKSRPLDGSRAFPQGGAMKANEELIGRHAEFAEALHPIRALDLEGQPQDREILPRELKHLCIDFKSDPTRLG